MITTEAYLPAIEPIATLVEAARISGHQMGIPERVDESGDPVMRATCRGCGGSIEVNTISPRLVGTAITLVNPCPTLEGALS